MGFLDLKIKAKISQRPLDIIYVIDTSASMDGKKIQTVNTAMHELEELLRSEARKNPNAQVNVRILTFGGSTSKWHLAEKTDVESFKYNDITQVSGMTPLGHALGELCYAFDNRNMPERGLKPIVVLLSDGMPNDDWEPNLERFLSLPWGRKALKIAIAIGKDADRNSLSRFTTDPEMVLDANTTTNLKNFIKWTSTLVTHNSKDIREKDENGKMIAAALKLPVAVPVHSDNSSEII